ncbi:MAG: class I SAM-dependent methyltransferase [Clostridia bacterium]|nr:class I SAM-dependent methyltransferase [Clostridia bacterium]MBQ5769809.1 class I SAM-dependent methyltransferase [Clostridia bacterium]
MLRYAYIRGASKRTGVPALPEDIIEKPLKELTESDREILEKAGREAELKLYRFKNMGDLPRVQKAIGFLKGVWPESLLDVGSGRGVFLFPFLEEFPFVPVTSADILDYRVEFLQDIARGGIENLTAIQENICSWNAPDKSFDVVTMLEVLEHIPEVEKAIMNAVRLAKRYVVVSVPSKEDDNPEHIHLLTKDILTDLFTRAGAKSLHFDGVNGHLFMTARV